MKKIVLKLWIEDEKAKRKALKVVAGVEGVESVAVDMEAQKITVVGNVDPVFLTTKLRRFGSTDLLTVGPAKEEEKKEDKKAEALYQYVPAYVPLTQQYHYDDPSACTIC